MSIQQWTLLVLLIGVFYRLIRYAVRMPIWGDEAMLAVNFLERDWEVLFEPLKNGQVLPIAYLAVSWILMTFAGFSEWVLRFPATIASITVLVLLYRFASTRFEQPQMLAVVSILAVSYYSVRHGVEFKPYSTDLLVALLLLILAFEVKLRPQLTSIRTLFAISICLAPFFSYPSVFVIAGCLAALVLDGLLNSNKSQIIFATLLGLVAVSIFGIYYVFYIQPHSSANNILFVKWRDAFPPADAWAFPGWLIKQSTGRIMAYPIGSNNYGSSLTFLAFLAGILSLTQKRQYYFLAILLLPFVFTIIASSLHLYPYGQSARIAQHLAPSICILSGFGVVWVFRLGKGRLDAKILKRRVIIFSAVLSFLGIAGMGHTIVKPYKTKGVQDVREVVENILSTHNCQPVKVLNPKDFVPVNFRWYLGFDRRADFAYAVQDLDNKMLDVECLFLFDAIRYPKLQKVLDNQLAKMVNKYSVIQDIEEKAFIYGGKNHPHTYRLVILQKTSS